MMPTRFLRFALAASFLSAVADRLGFWGAAGAPNVAWGDWSSFVAYVAKLNWFAPRPLVPLIAVLATGAEIVLALALVAGIWLRTAAFLSGILLATFAMAMTVASGIKAPLDYSVFSAAGAAFLLSAVSTQDLVSRRVGNWWRSMRSGSSVPV